MRFRFNPRNLLRSNQIPKVSSKLEDSRTPRPCIFSYPHGGILFLPHSYPFIWWEVMGEMLPIISKCANLPSRSFGVTTAFLACDSLVRPQINDKPECSASQSMWHVVPWAWIIWGSLLKMDSRSHPRDRDLESSGEVLRSRRVLWGLLLHANAQGPLS